MDNLVKLKEQGFPGRLSYLSASKSTVRFRRRLLPEFNYSIIASYPNFGLAAKYGGFHITVGGVNVYIHVLDFVYKNGNLGHYSI